MHKQTISYFHEVEGLWSSFSTFLLTVMFLERLVGYHKTSLFFLTISEHCSVLSRKVWLKGTVRCPLPRTLLAIFPLIRGVGRSEKVLPQRKVSEKATGARGRAPGKVWKALKLAGPEKTKTAFCAVSPRHTEIFHTFLCHCQSATKQRTSTATSTASYDRQSLEQRLTVVVVIKRAWLYTGLNFLLW